MNKNLTLLTDLYQLTMMQGYYQNNTTQTAVFEMFYRKNPSQNGFAIFAGLHQFIDYINNINFDVDSLEYLKSLNIFTPDFLEYLKNFKFTGDIYSIPEGTIIFPEEPLLRVTAPILEAQFIETTMLNIINHQSLIATKASRVVHAANGDPVLEFGLRRAQGPDSSLYGARAAIIGGCSSTSNVLAGKEFDVKISGTQAHSWIMSFKSELDAFRKYADLFPDKCLLLVDTYDTITSGIPNAITVFDELKAKGLSSDFYGIRLDSGDLAYLSKKARKMLDAAGHKEAKICASCDLDEYLIADLKRQGAKIDTWGVGTKLITSDDCPSFGGVYKLVAEKNGNNNFIPKIKLSDNPDKVTRPGVKKIIRVYDKENYKIKIDIIALEDEHFDESKTYIISDHKARWKKMTIQGGTYITKELLIPIFLEGTCVYNTPTVMEIHSHTKQELNTLWDEFKRLVNPERLPVDLSDKLYELKTNMIEEYRAVELI
ncbi:nicotinate phosphoribosyltransferase [Candidatus Epulonipiscium fishelsonii]|uniref:Nicotinate phosphoribosyltransferase n=1 Tax=Candidatus Epulonipiscium fishelsonii TaxID=77094 RepID=A0ACC8XD91_9FIRM|nr:nicotinate phosphoribosyltransferase [Epulopiscium sp. SCG-B11WGA-EpuloA1]